MGSLLDVGMSCMTGGTSASKMPWPDTKQSGHLSGGDKLVSTAAGEYSAGFARGR
jgi:hypothetical protein